MSVNNVNNDFLESLSIGNRETKKKDDLGREDFLKLMTTQLSNQDPMKPMENGEFFTQIAQFSAVSGIHDLKNSFDSLAGALKSNQMLQASTMIGKSVLVDSNEINITGREGVLGSIEIPTRSDNVKVNVYDGAGQLVRTMDGGSQLPGNTSFVWDLMDNRGNRVKDGVYTIMSEAKSGDKTYALKTSIADSVDSVSVDSKGNEISLNLTGMGEIKFSKVKQVM